MTDQECEELVEFLRGQFLEIQEPELAQLADYTEETEDGWVRPSPRARLVKMLDAFEAVVSLEDVNTYHQAKEVIGVATDGQVPEFQIEMIGKEAGQEGEKVRFNLADQSEIRSALRELRTEIERDGDLGEFED